MSNVATSIERRLSLRRATQDAIKPFGALLGRSDADAAPPSGFYQGHLRMAHPVDFRCDHPVDLQLATLARRTGEVRYLERHFQHTQTFIPLGGKPFVMVLAPPSIGAVPDMATAQALFFDGRQGVTLNLGVWHEFPFAIEHDTDLVVVLSSQTGYDLAAKDPVTQEASGPDLDKKDVVARTGVRLTVDLDARPVG